MACATVFIYFPCAGFLHKIKLGLLAPANLGLERSRTSGITSIETHYSNRMQIRLRSRALLAVALVCFLQTGSFSQTEKPKRKMQADSLLQLSDDFYRQYQIQPALQSAQAALEIYQPLWESEGEAKALNRVGVIYMDLTDFPKAEEHLQKALQVSREIGQPQNLILTLHNLGTLHKATRKYDAALEAFKEALEIAEATGDELKRAEQWKNLGGVYADMDKIVLAFDNLNKALKHAQKTNNDSLIAATLLSLGSAATAKSDFLNAAVYWEQGLSLAKKTKNLRLEGSFLSNLGNSYRNTGKYPEALSCLKQALQINRVTHNRWTEGNTLRELGIVFYFQGQPDSSLRCWNDAIEVFKTIPDMLMVGMTSGHIGVYYKNIGKPFEALKAYENALAMVRDAGNEREEANILGNIGNVYSDVLADYDRAESYHKKALAIKERFDEKAFIGRFSQILGVLEKHRGNFQASLTYYHRALEIARQSGDQALVARLNGNIGTIYLDLNEVDKAIQYLNTDLEAMKKIGETRSMPEVLINLGATHAKMGNDSLALSYYDQAESLATKQHLRSFVIDSYLNKGEIHNNRGKIDLARQAYQNALQLAKEIADLRAQFWAFNILGKVEMKERDFSAALKNFNQALSIALKTQAQDLIWRAYWRLGSAYENLGETAQALKHYTAAVDSIESQRAKLTIESLKLSFLEEKLEAYHALIQLLLKSRRIEEAFNYLERAKARSLLDVLSTKGSSVISGISPDLLQRKKENEFLLRRVNELLSKAHADQKPAKDKIAALQDSLYKVRFAYEKLLQEIQLKHPRYAELTGNTRPLTLREIQQKIIPPGTVLIEYLVTEKQTFGFLVRSDTVRCLALDLTEAEARAAVDTLLHDARAAGSGDIRNLADLRFNLKTAERLHRKLVAPLEPEIPGGSALIVVPDGILHYLPFEALVVDIKKDPPAEPKPAWYERIFPSKNAQAFPLFHEYERARFLVEKYAISYAPSASVLNPALLRARDQAPSAEKLGIFASPDFGGASNDQLKSIYDAAVSSLSMLILMGPNNEWHYPPLLKTQSHARELAQKVKPARIFISKEAKEETFKQEAGKYRYVHIATHAVTEERMPMYSRIVFAQDEDPAEDGLLHAHEILNLRLQADLVTLIGCRTGLGRLSHGEGLVGLARAFLYAGTPSLVVSLWVVEELSGLVMNHFYENIERGLTKAEALRQAKLRMIKSHGKLSDDRKISYAHPFLWAPFVLVGSAQ